ncbi:MAG: glycoside hydrolase family 9 protein, partial [Candidatus Brocadiae bacterium]|nr:glycoside hydrolase family 9 protein [Candidatus Brocadiia bacterium]
MSRTVCGAIVAVAALALAAEAAEERVLPIAPLPDRQAWTDYYYVEGAGTKIERAHGGIPIVDWQGKKALKIHVTHAPGGRWQVGIAKKGWGHFQLDDYGRDGTLEFDLWGDLPAGSEIQMGDSDTDGGGPDREVVSRVRLGRYVPEGAGWRRVAVPLGDFLDAEPELELAYMLKLVLSGPSQQGESTFYVADLGFHTTRPERVYAAVKVDQVGYPPEWAKVAKVTPARPFPDGGGFLVKRADSGEVVHSGRMKEAVLADGPSGDNVYDADFSKLSAPGDYVVEVPGVGQSAAFRIASDAYDVLLHDVARFWFFQRCGMELKADHAGPYAHRACHVHDEAIPDPRGGTRDCRGGWHDAGDMNRYAPWTLHPVWMLLSLYRHYPDKFSDGQFNIPESGNGVP